MRELIHVESEIDNLFKEGACAPYTKVESGFGYAGVLIKQITTGALQCHICGAWHMNLSYHIKLHGITVREYKIRFGFSQNRPLCSVECSRKMREHSLRLIREGKRFGYHKHIKRKKGRSRGGRIALSILNERSTCPDQLIRRAIIVADKIGKSPSMSEAKIYDPHLVTTARSRFKSWNNFKRQCGLDVRRQNITTEDKIISYLRQWAKDHKCMPKAKNFIYARNGYCNLQTIIKRFGSWNRALIAAGFVPKERMCPVCGRPVTKPWINNPKRYCSTLCRDVAACRRTKLHKQTRGLN